MAGTLLNSVLQKYSVRPKREELPCVADCQDTANFSNDIHQLQLEEFFSQHKQPIA